MPRGWNRAPDDCPRVQLRKLMPPLAVLGVEDREESSTVESASSLEPQRSSGTCPVQGETFRAKKAMGDMQGPEVDFLQDA